jgi:hypothetical protein
MKNKDQVLLEKAYNEAISNPSVMSSYQNFRTEEADKLDVFISNFLYEFVDTALKNPAVLKHFSEKYSLSPEDLDQKYMLIQRLLFDFAKESTFVDMSASMQDQIAQRFSK